MCRILFEKNCLKKQIGQAENVFTKKHWSEMCLHSSKQCKLKSFDIKITAF